MTAADISTDAARPDYPAIVHTYTDALIVLRDRGAQTPGELAAATNRDPSNIRRDLRKLFAAEVINGDGGGGTAVDLTDKGQRWVVAMDVAAGAGMPSDAAAPGDVLELHPDQLRPDPDQPRKAFDPADLEALAQSIAAKGVLLPILARPAAQVAATDDAYPGQAHMIIAGERRWRACMKIVGAGEWPEGRTVTVRIATPDDEADAFETAVVENMQRADLNHMEMGQAFERMALAGKSNKEIGAVVNRTPEFVQQHRRLLRLDPDLQQYVADGRLTHHEALKMLAGPTRGGEGGEAPSAPAEADDATLPMFDGAGAPPATDSEAEPEPETEWTRGGFKLIQELRANGAAIPSVCSRAPVARLYRKGDAFHTRYRVQVTVDFGGGHVIESAAIPGAEQAHIAVAMATDDIMARWPAGRSIPPRPFIEWLDKATGQANVVAGRFCDSAEAAQARRVALGWVTVPTPPPAPATAPEADPDAAPALKPRQRLILIELAHKIAAQPRLLDPTGEAEWSGAAEADYAVHGTDCGSYWLDQGFNDLASMRLVRANHQPGGTPPMAALTPKGIEWFLAEGVPIPPADFQVQAAQGACGAAGQFDTPDRYATTWLANVAKAPETPAPTPQPAGNEDPWDRDADQIAADEALLESVHRVGLDHGDLFRSLGVGSARVDSDGWINLCDADGRTLTTVGVDEHNDLPDQRGQALEHLIVAAINRTLGVE